MFKKIIIIVSISISFYVSAMETSICHLAKLSIEVQNLIASFVMDDYETDEEFIARTSVKKKEVFMDHYDHFALKIDSIVPKKWGIIKHRDKKINRVESCNRLKILLIQALAAMHSHNFCTGFIGLTVVDKEKNEMMYHMTADVNESFGCFALSRLGNIIIRAMCKKHDYTEDHFFIGASYKIELKIQNLKTNTMKTFEPDYTLNRINALEFNKQGTSFIIRGGKNVMDENDVSCYQLFSLKDLTKICPVSEKITPIKNLLQYYFREKGVCKSITSGS